MLLALTTVAAVAVAIVTANATCIGGGSPARYARIRPDDALRLPVFNGFTRNTTVVLPPTADGGARQQRVAEAAISWPRPLDVTSRFAVLPGVVTRDEVAAIHALIQDAGLDFNNEPDTVDALPSHEIFVHEGSTRDIDEDLGGDFGRAAERAALRLRLRALMGPIEARITHIVRQRYPDQCGEGRPAGRRCTPCFSLVRRYLPDERRGHGMHRDGQALVTVVTSLSDYGDEYEGGLYVSAGRGRHALALNRGDAVIHQSDLLHGVQVVDPPQARHDPSRQARRWSWILWYKDSEACEQFGYEWSRACAERGNPLCEYMYGWRMFLNPALKAIPGEAGRQRERWMRRSAEHGLAEAMFKTARNELAAAQETGNYGSVVRWLEKAVLGGDADAAYQLGHLMLLGLVEEDAVTAEVVGWQRGNGGGDGAGEAASAASAGQAEEEEGDKDARCDAEADAGDAHAPGSRALALFETAAAQGSSMYGGTRFSFYNLGVAALYGFGGRARDPVEAAEWFLKSGLPEGLQAYALYLKSQGRRAEARRFRARAKRMGFGDPRRKGVRDQGLFGLHNDWPGADPRRRPPKWV